MTNEKTIYFEAHIDLDDMPLSQVEGIYDEIESLLKKSYGICYVTLQPEVDKCRDKRFFIL